MSTEMELGMTSGDSHGTFQQLLARLKSDPERSVAERLSGIALGLVARIRARWAFRRAQSLGHGVRAVGPVRVENRGRLVIGPRVAVTSTWVPTEFQVGPSAQMDVGEGVWINYGSVIAAARGVRIGAGTMIGQFCIISDIDVPEAVGEIDPAAARPIEIGANVWLAGRVTVRPGVKIGDGTVVMAGSVVETDLPPNTMAGGIPARVLAKPGESAAATQPSATPPPVAATDVPARGGGHLVADFTIDELALDLADPEDGARYTSVIAPYAQVAQVLLTEPPPGGADFAVVWTLAETAVPAFGRLLAYEDVELAAVDAEVDAFCALIRRGADHYRTVFVASWAQPPWRRGFGLTNGRTQGASSVLARMNLRLMTSLADLPNVYVLDAGRWLMTVGPKAWNTKAWYLGKMAFHRGVLREAAADIRAGLASLSGGPRKLLVLDLDDTLWGGIVGDAGWENLRLGGLDGVGEAYADFQSAIRDLKRRGVVLAIVSKNEESVALEAIRNHPGMKLGVDDFVGWRINWRDKAANIAELAAQLNLGLQSIVFIDDNPVERARVRHALPEVLVPEWPKSPFLYRSTLEALRCFDAPSRSREDLERTRMYADERQREALKAQVGSVDEWLRELGIRVSASPLGPDNVVRATQLLNKTNQLNLATRRLTEAELTTWAATPGQSFWTISVADRLGEAGLTGLLGLERRGTDLHIVDFVLSCRVMGRRVEESMVHFAVARAREAGAERVVAQYLPTAKNKPCLTFWQGSGFAATDENRFVWDAAQPYALPDVVDLSMPGPA